MLARSTWLGSRPARLPLPPALGPLAPGSFMSGPRCRPMLPRGVAHRRLVAAASAHSWRDAAWPTLGGLLRLALALGCPASAPHAVNVRSGAIKIFPCLGRARETGRDRQHRWRREKRGGQD